MTTIARPRSRGSKTVLTRAAIAAAALDALADGGPSGLSMRKVATRLDTAASSLYAHVRDLEDLHGLVLDSMTSTIGLKREADSAQAAVVTLMQSYATALRQHPGTAAIALTSPPVGPGFLDFGEAVASELAMLGLGPTEIMGTFDKLVLLVAATVAEQEASWRADPTISIGDRYTAALADQAHAGNAYPRLEAIMAAGRPSDVDDITWSVSTFLRGLTSP